MQYCLIGNSSKMSMSWTEFCPPLGNPPINSPSTWSAPSSSLAAALRWMPQSEVLGPYTCFHNPGNHSRSSSNRKAVYSSDLSQFLLSQRRSLPSNSLCRRRVGKINEFISEKRLRALDERWWKKFMLFFTFWVVKGKGFKLPPIPWDLQWVP